MACQRDGQFVRWRLHCWCVDAAQRDLGAAAFLLDGQIPIDDRFEVAARIPRQIWRRLHGALTSRRF